MVNVMLPDASGISREATKTGSGYVFVDNGEPVPGYNSNYTAPQTQPQTQAPEPGQETVAPTSTGSSNIAGPGQDIQIQRAVRVSDTEFAYKGYDPATNNYVAGSSSALSTVDYAEGLQWMQVHPDAQPLMRTADVEKILENSFITREIKPTGNIVIIDLPRGGADVDARQRDILSKIPDGTAVAFKAEGTDAGANFNQAGRYYVYNGGIIDAGKLTKEGYNPYVTDYGGYGGPARVNTTGLTSLNIVDSKSSSKPFASPWSATKPGTTAAPTADMNNINGQIQNSPAYTAPEAKAGGSGLGFLSVAGSGAFNTISGIVSGAVGLYSGYIQGVAKQRDADWAMMNNETAWNTFRDRSLPEEQRKAAFIGIAQANSNEAISNLPLDGVGGMQPGISWGSIIRRTPGPVASGYNVISGAASKTGTIVTDTAQGTVDAVGARKIVNTVYSSSTRSFGEQTIEVLSNPESLIYRSPGSVITDTITGIKGRNAGYVYKYPENAGEFTAPTSDQMFVRPSDEVYVDRGMGIFDEYHHRAPADIETVKNFVPESEYGQYRKTVNAMPKTNEDQFIESINKRPTYEANDIGIAITPENTGEMSTYELESKLRKYQNFYSGIPIESTIQKSVSNVREIYPKFGYAQTTYIKTLPYQAAYLPVSISIASAKYSTKSDIINVNKNVFPGLIAPTPKQYVNTDNNTNQYTNDETSKQNSIIPAFFVGQNNGQTQPQTTITVPGQSYISLKQSPILATPRSSLAIPMLPEFGGQKSYTGGYGKIGAGYIHEVKNPFLSSVLGAKKKTSKSKSKKGGKKR